MKKIIIYCIAGLAVAVPFISLAITGDPLAGSTQGPSYKVEWSNEKFLTHEDVALPDLSPDGTRVVFIRYKNGYTYSEIWVTNSDGTDAKALLSERRKNYNSPVWSPDGTKIVFLKNFAFEMWQINADGTKESPLTEKKYEKMHPAWWPDGSKILYYKGMPLNETIPIEWEGLYNLDLTTLEVNPFGEPEWGGPVTFSPDAQTLVIREGQELLFLNPDGTLKEKKTITAPLNHGEEPVWTPNDKYIILGNILYVIATGEEIPFLPQEVVTYKEEGKPDLVGPISVTLSKDGKKLAFVMEEPESGTYRGKIKILDLVWE